MPHQRYTPQELLGDLNDIEQKNAPEELFAAGDIGLLRQGPRVSVVGSRKASPEACARTRFFCRALVEHNITVVSGLAEGIDAEAHSTAIREGGRTVGVLGTSLDEFYPKKNRELQERMMREQLVVSQFPVGYPSARKNFPMRNRTMALLCDATVIIEAGEKSGTLHQGWEALRLGRLLFLMESVATNSDLSWPKEMIRYGAQVLSRENLDHVLAEIPEGVRGEAVSF